MKTKHKTVLISGGASGMGAATAVLLAQAGMQVAILDQQQNLANDLAKQIQGIAVMADVTDDKAVTAAVAKVVEKFGDIHVGVNCAGIAHASRIAGKNGPMPLLDFQRVIQVNLIGTFNVMRCLAARMIQQAPITPDHERGVIINTASIAAYEGQVGQAAYSASKGGIISMTLPSAREFSQFGVRVMAIAPGIISTPMMAKMPDEVTTGLAATVPFPKRLGLPEEYASLVQHIIENPYLNGSVIRLDGSLRLPIK